MSKKVTCGLCRHEDQGICTVKKIGVKVGKRRSCDSYRLDMAKVVIRPKPKSRYAPLYEVDGSVRRKLVKAINEQREAEAQQKALYDTTVSQPPSYLSPAPDCLANVRSSVDSDE